MQNYETQANPLFLDAAAVSVKVNVRPLVLMHIVDCYARRNTDQTRVIGTLLGYKTEGEITITNAFAVPHSENELQVAVNMEFHTKMYELHQKVNPKEVILGWYATGDKINDYSLLIHEFYSNQSPSPVHLTLDTLMSDGDMSIKAYKSLEFGPPGNEQNVGTAFVPLQTQVVYNNSEGIAIDMLQKVPKETRTSVALMTDKDHLIASVSTLLEMIKNVTAYVKKVLGGEIPGSSKIGKMLLDVVSTIPDFDTDSFDKLFNNNIQDMLMVTYLTEATRTQLNIAEKLYTTL